MTSRRHPVPLAATIVTMGIAATLALTGCTPSSLSAGDAAMAGTQLHPVGDLGHWFGDGYSDGAHVGYSTSNEVCRVTDSLIVEQQVGPDYESRVVAKELVRGQVAWEIFDATCGPGGDIDGTMPIKRGSVWEFVEIATGKVTQAVPNVFTSAPAAPLTRVGDTLVVQQDESSIVGIRDGKIVWTAGPYTGGRIDIAVLADGRLGVKEVFADRASILDGRTGETVAEFDLPDRSSPLTWASDGYVLRINESGPEYAFYDVHGTEVERTKTASQYRFVPAPADGVLFPIADHVAAGRVVGVDASGHPALFQDERQRDHTRKGEIELPSSILSLRGLSRDGELLLFDDVDGDDDRVTVIDAAGETVFELSLPGGGTARVEAGLILVESGETTQVLFPGK